MQGAGKYAIPMYSTYEQLGLEKLYDKSTRSCVFMQNMWYLILTNTQEGEH